MHYEFDVYGTALEPHPDPNNTVTRLGEMFRRAERYGFEGLLSFYNHRNLDPWVVASTLLQSTKTLNPLVALNPYALPPFTAAKTINSLVSFYGRRVDINVITGAAPQELEQIGDSITHDQRYDRAVEYVTVLRQLLSSNAPLTFEGKYYHFKDLSVSAEIPAGLMPRVFVAGASPASKKMADAIGDIAVTHPEPVGKFAESFLAPRRSEGDDGPAVGIRIGLLARPTNEEAWALAHERYPSDRYSRMKTAMRRNSDSEWSRRIAELATDGDRYDDVYWTGAYLADKGSAPLFVGGYEEVAGYVAKYLDLGIRTILLGSVYTEDDFRHVSAVLSLLRGKAVRLRAA